MFVFLVFFNCIMGLLGDKIKFIYYFVYLCVLNLFLRKVLFLKLVMVFVVGVCK